MARLKEEIKWNTIKAWMMRSGEVMVWAGDKAELCGSLIDSYGKWDDNEVGQPITGRIGLFRFEALSYDKDRDLFQVRKI